MQCWRKQRSPSWEGLPSGALTSGSPRWVSTNSVCVERFIGAHSVVLRMPPAKLSYRLVVEGHACMLFGTVSTAQKFHIIGYAVCDKEDDAAHDHVFRSLKGEVERIVAERSRDQVKI